MKMYKIIIAFIVLAIPSCFVLAETTNLSNEELITQIKALITKNNSTIEDLKIQNQKLEAKLLELNWTWAVTTITNSWAINNSWNKASTVEKYNILIDKVNSISNKIFSDFKMWTWAEIGLFEFIEPSNFFISIDDGLNPTWVTAFKKKVLYSYDKDYNLNVEWIFDLDYKSQYYVTKYWKNPFVKAIRIRVKNPIYKGKLLNSDTQNQTSTSTWTTTKTSTDTTKTTTKTDTTSSTISSENVTLQDVTTAYSKNKILDAIKLSNEYIKKDPNNLDVLKIRYRSYYVVWKYTEALQEIQKYIQIKWDATEKSIYCEAKVIAKLNKSADLLTTYTNLCSGKK